MEISKTEREKNDHLRTHEMIINCQIHTHLIWKEVYRFKNWNAIKELRSTKIIILRSSFRRTFQSIWKIKLLLFRSKLRGKHINTSTNTLHSRVTNTRCFIWARWRSNDVGRWENWIWLCFAVLHLKGFL